jgi:hypothetical protein
METFSNLLKEDQNNIKLFREGKISQNEFNMEADSISGKYIKACQSQGFLYKDSGDLEEYRAGIVLLLHAPTQFIEEMLNKFTLLDSGKIDPADLAYLIDKVKVQKEEKQVYGTQFKKGSNGEIIFLPIDSKRAVDERRKAVGVCTLDEYEAFIRGERDSVYKTKQLL